MTNFERIKAMSKQEIAHTLLSWEELKMPDYCRNLRICEEELDADIEIPMERCKECVCKWLEEEYHD